MRPRRGGVAVPSLAAGVLLALSLPPFGAWPLAFLGAALVYWRLASLRLRARLLAGWLAGIGCFAIGLSWAVSFNWYGAVVLVLVEAAFPAVAAAATPPRHGRAPAFIGAATLLEAARQRVPFGGLPVGGVFLGQAGGPLLSTARLGGPLLLTALVWTAGMALAELVRWARGHGGAPALRAGTAAVVLVVGVAVAGTFAPDGGPPVSSLRIAAVQGGGVRGLTELETGRAGDFAAELAATEPLVRARPRPQLVLWPEDVIAISVPVNQSEPGRLVAALARQLHATVLAGVTEPVGARRFRNEIVAWGPNGRMIGTFEKVHRVPFGEYVPDRGFFSHLANLAAVSRDAIPGHGSGLLRTPAGPVGVLVSFEVFFADRGRSAVAAGAQVLLVPTNTSSYSSDQMPSQEVAADQVQAVAEGRDLVQASPTGYSTFVTNRGEVVRTSALSVRTVLTGIVPRRRGTTVYQRWDDTPVLALAGLSVLAGLGVHRHRASHRDRAVSRARRAGPQPRGSPSVPAASSEPRA
jgi:apolipoprotein N-acyltransferase